MTLSGNPGCPPGRFGKAPAVIVTAVCVFVMASGPSAHDPGAVSDPPPDIEVDRSVLEALESAPESREIPSSVTRGPDGLPIYDVQLGPPRSHVIGLAAPVRLRRPAAAGIDDAAPLPSVPESEAPPPPRPIPSLPPAPAVPAMNGGTETTDISPPARAAPTPAATMDPPPEPDLAAAPAPNDAASTAVEVGGALTVPVSVLFRSGDSELPGAAPPLLDRVAGSLEADPALRIRLKAYADATDITSSAARRLSLLRALSVRTYLIDAGIDATRIDVRALGAKYEDGPSDRVDIVGVR